MAVVLASSLACTAGSAFLRKYNADDIMLELNRIMKECHVTDVDKEHVPIHCDLAVKFGKLTKESVMKMDDNLKVEAPVRLRSISGNSLPQLFPDMLRNRTGAQALKWNAVHEGIRPFA